MMRPSLTDIGPMVSAWLTEHRPSTVTQHVSASYRRMPCQPPEARLVEVEGVRWLAVQVAFASEWRARAELAALGFRAYCPATQRYVFAARARSGRRFKTLRIEPVFARYLFLGAPPGYAASARRLRDALAGSPTADRIEAVLGEATGGLAIPPRAIQEINRLELSGEWDHTGPWRKRATYRPGELVRITDGPFAEFEATVDAATSEDRIRVLVSAFAQPIPVDLDCCQVEKLAL